MTDKETPKRILVCDTQPVAIEGIRALLQESGDLRFVGAVCNLDAAMELARTMSPAVVLLDKGLGVAALMNWLHNLGTARVSTAAAVWGTGISEGEALR